jgi:hypothetical protein
VFLLCIGVSMVCYAGSLISFVFMLKARTSVRRMAVGYVTIKSTSWYKPAVPGFCGDLRFALHPFQSGRRVGRSSMIAVILSLFYVKCVWFASFNSRAPYQGTR